MVPKSLIVTTLRAMERGEVQGICESLDSIKDLGFEYATRAGLTISVADVKTPAAKRGLLDTFEAEASKVESLYERGVIATNLPLPELKQRSHINAAAKAADQDPNFSRVIRQGLPGMEP